MNGHLLAFLYTKELHDRTTLMFCTKEFHERTTLTVLYQRTHEWPSFIGTEGINHRATLNCFVPLSKEMFNT
jgi:hypothetical protein